MVQQSVNSPSCVCCVYWQMIARLGKELETRAAQMEEMKKQLLQETKANTSLKKEITVHACIYCVHLCEVVI